MSEFNQFTVWPTFTITGFGEYTPFLIVTVSRLGGFVPSGLVGEIGELVVGLVELPHPTAKSASKMIAPTVDRVALESLKTMFQGGATPVPSRQAGPLRQPPSRKMKSEADLRHLPYDEAAAEWHGGERARLESLAGDVHLLVERGQRRVVGERIVDESVEAFPRVARSTR
jgi:hypothetical protein